MNKPKDFDSWDETRKWDWLEKIKERQRKYYEKNRDKILKYNKERYHEHHKKNPEKIAERKRKYREKNREKIAERKRKYREKNREKLAKYKREYCKKNREKIAEYKRNYRKAKSKNKLEKPPGKSTCIINYSACRERSPELLKYWRDASRKYRQRNPDKILDKNRKYMKAKRQQSAADQFFIMAGAAEQLTKITKTKP